MYHEQYQNAFSKLEPSQELIDAALSPQQNDRARRGVHIGNVLLAAILTLAVLTGTAFAAVHFQWFHIGSAENIVQPTRDAEAIGKDAYLPPEPQNLLTLSGEPSDTHIGFTLPESYQDGQDTLNCWRLEKDLYRRYYRNPDPSDPNSPFLTVEIVYHADYLIRYSSKIVKEETLNGMQTVWLRLDNSADGRPQYCLFQRNDALGCFAVIASTTGFEEAEQAAKDLCYEDSGIPITQTEDKVHYGFRLDWTPEDMAIDSRTVMADRWYLANATLRDESLDLSEILLGSNWLYQGETSCTIGIWINEDLTDIAPVESATAYKTGTINDHDVRWIYGNDDDTYIQVIFREQQVQLLAKVSCYGLNPVTGAMEAIPEEERFIKIAERFLESAELIPVAIAEEAPANFDPFVVG